MDPCSWGSRVSEGPQEVSLALPLSLAGGAMLVVLSLKVKLGVLNQSCSYVAGVS